MSLRELLAIFPPDRCDVPFTAKRVDVARNEYENTFLLDKEQAHTGTRCYPVAVRRIRRNPNRALRRH